MGVIWNATKLTDPLVCVEFGSRGYVRVLKQGDVAICWISELSLPERSVIPMTDPSHPNPGPECFDLSGIMGDEYLERSSSFDVAHRRASGQQDMLAQLESDRPVVALYLDENGEFYILQDGEVDVRCVDGASSFGKITVWLVERYVLHNMVTGKRIWFHPQDPLGSDRESAICPIVY